MSEETPEYGLRYSPRPLAQYTATFKVRGAAPTVIGVGASAYVAGDRPLWNLLWLSFDYDRHVQHPDADFTVVMRRTLDEHESLRPWLWRPAPAFVHRLMGMDPAVREGLNAYRRYGQRWLQTVEQRSFLAQAPGRLDPVLDRADLPIERKTLDLLESIRLGRTGQSQSSGGPA